MLPNINEKTTFFGRQKKKWDSQRKGLGRSKKGKVFGSGKTGGTLIVVLESTYITRL